MSASTNTPEPDIDASKITSGVIGAARLPSYVDDVLEFSSFDDFPLEGETGKIYVAIDTNKTYRWSGTSYIYITSGAVDSVAGKTGVVILNKNDVGLNQVDNTSDVNKPISTATANALALKADIESPAFTGEPKAPTAAVGNETTQVATTAFVGAEIADKAYSKTQLDAGQLDNRYYTEAEIDTKLAEQNAASEISYDGTVSELVAANVQDAIDEVEDRLDTAEGAIADVNLTRADKYLGSQNVVKMLYNPEGKLSKVRYNNGTDVDYEVLTYNLEGKLSNVAHYVESVLRGNTTLSYENGKLVAAPYTAV